MFCSKLVSFNLTELIQNMFNAIPVYKFLNISWLPLSLCKHKRVLLRLKQLYDFL